MHALKVGRRGEKEVAQTMYTHVSKCKKDKIKGEKERFLSWKMKKSGRFMVGCSL
jgi:hypothetical protein